VIPAHRQLGSRVRLEWGPTGAAALAPDVDVAVVVDVLSFTTTLTVAADGGTVVHPFPWRDERAEAYAAAHDAVLATGRSGGTHRVDGAFPPLDAESAQSSTPLGPVDAGSAPSSTPAGGVSLSPTSVREAQQRPGGLPRLVLPSPNGSTISAALAESGARVVGAALRNASAVGRWLAGLDPETRVLVVPSGERWPDGSLRPAVEDLWGAGAVLAALVDAGSGADAGLSAEARFAAAAWRAVAPRPAEELAACASGQELLEAGYADDVTVAAEVDASDAVPVLEDGAYRPG
jgi:2-phosphosulfolactate phosphatase